MIGIRTTTEVERQFIETFSTLCRAHSAWEVWEDFCYLAASAIANRFDKAQFRKREDGYLKIIGRYEKSDQNRFPKLMGAVVEALEMNPWQDFLGSMFMRLNLGNHWRGQFFTPYHISEFMAQISAGNLKEQIQQEGYISVSDPCCGGGAMLVAFAETCVKQKVNYQEHVIFAAQDIDQTAALMCYIQMSLLGCPGYVTIDDTLAHPQTGDPLFIQPADNVWLTPFYFSQVWQQLLQGNGQPLQRFAESLALLGILGFFL